MTACLSHPSNRALLITIIVSRPCVCVSTQFTDGTEYTFQRRERPEAILKDGHIIGLISGVSDTRQGPQDPKSSRRDYSWTLVQPVRTKTDDDGAARLAPK